MKATKLSLCLALALILSSCYHAKIATDKNPSRKVIEKEWAHGFLYGLVPPETINADDRCSNGAARVETKLSFLNLLASVLTSSLYTPMHITVTCAEDPEITDKKEKRINLAGHPPQRR